MQAEDGGSWCQGGGDVYVVGDVCREDDASNDVNVNCKFVQSGS